MNKRSRQVRYRKKYGYEKKGIRQVRIRKRMKWKRRELEK